ncbi:uncharacterized protein LOC131886093 [Tigriopus californicus]|nr:uncharacterized protein LOC131886093 [Tigriopus californicus]
MKLSLFLIFCLGLITLLSLTPESEAATRRQLRRGRAGLRRVQGRSQSVSPRRSHPYPLQYAAQRSVHRPARLGKSVRRTNKSGRRGKAVRRRQKSRRNGLRRKQTPTYRPRSRTGKKTKPMARRQSRRYQKRVQSSYRKAGRRSRGRKQRRGRKALQKYFRRRYRSGRQEGEVVEEVEPIAPTNAEEAEETIEAMDEAVEDPEMQNEVDANGDGIPDWCNPIKPMGAWLNFRKMKLWCADRGFTKFGPYGGVPTEAPETTADGEDADGSDLMEGEEDAMDYLDYEMEAEDPEADQAALEEGGDEDVDY